MSRPIVRIAISAVIVFALVIGIYASVQGALLNRDAASSGAAATHHGLDRNRPTINGPASSQPAAPESSPQKGEGGCDRDAMIESYD